MADDKLPEKWKRSSKAVKAVQVAFSLDEAIQKKIRRSACLQDISPSDMIRSIVKLPTSAPPKRPRLTASFTPLDYEILAQRYGVDANDTLEIKKHVMQELIDFAEQDEP